MSSIYIDIEIKNFITILNNKYNSNINTQLYTLRDKRCLARKWDLKKKSDINGVNINKQCKNKSVIGNLCKTCFNIHHVSMIYEYPYDELINLYEKKFTQEQNKNNPLFLGRNISEEIDLKKYELYIDSTESKVLNKPKVSVINTSTQMVNPTISIDNTLIVNKKTVYSEAITSKMENLIYTAINNKFATMKRSCQNSLDPSINEKNKMYMATWLETTKKIIADTMVNKFDTVKEPCKTLPDSSSIKEKCIQTLNPTNACSDVSQSISILKDNDSTCRITGDPQSNDQSRNLSDHNEIPNDTCLDEQVSIKKITQFTYASNENKIEVLLTDTDIGHEDYVTLQENVVIYSKHVK